MAERVRSLGGALDASLHNLVEQARRDLTYNAARASTAHLARAREIVAVLAGKPPAPQHVRGRRRNLAGLTAP